MGGPSVTTWWTSRMFDYILTTRSLEREATIKLAHFISLYCCS
jgi:hypothetical protein